MSYNMCLKHETRTVKRKTKRRCELTGYQIDPGDRVVDYAGLSEGDFCHAIYFQVAGEICENRDKSDEFNEWGFCFSSYYEYLEGWLRLQGLDKSEVKKCVQEAIRLSRNPVQAKEAELWAEALSDEEVDYIYSQGGYWTPGGFEEDEFHELNEYQKTEVKRKWLESRS